MIGTNARVLRIALAAIVGAGGLFVSEKILQPGSLVTSAHAIIGRPLTPMSYAGVARRSAVGVGVGVGVGVAVGVAVAAPVMVAPACVQVVNVYGQITTVCR
jgi:carbonic anhydrase/acetyltransferase-like protein (isoleucine patch superfamily)